MHLNLKESVQQSSQSKYWSLNIERRQLCYGLIPGKVTKSGKRGGKMHLGVLEEGAGRIHARNARRKNRAGRIHALSTGE